MKTILVTAYAVNPYKGSEDGMGWNFVLQIARHQRVIAVTRENNRPNIEKYMQANPSDSYGHITFLYFDLPYWMRFWKKGSRGAMLYYLMWQKGLVSFIRKQNLHFDIAHNLNFHNDWTPSFLWKLGKPFVWGPVGHHPIIPAQYLEPYQKTHLIKDRITWWIKQYYWKISPLLKKTIQKADHILCMNSGVPKVLNLKERFSIAPSVATQDFGWQNTVSTQKFRLISAGRFVPLKGFDLTIQAFAKFFHALPDHEKASTDLVLVGNGPEEERLRKLAKKLQVADQVAFIAWMDRADLLKLFADASAFLFPSHEGAGMVVAEALSFGLPVICLDNEGPGNFITPECGFAVKHSDYSSTVMNLAKAIQTLQESSLMRQKMKNAARKQFEAKFNWNIRGEQLQQIYAAL
jgi:glycosyltransferase involved in cell wall biosynthesis